MSNLSISTVSGMYSNALSLTSKTSGIDWDKIPHKGMKRPSDAEFKGIIDDLAKGLAKANYNNNSSEYKKLRSKAEKACAQYVSAVSPDRKKMVKEASELIKQTKSNSSKRGSKEPETLFDFLDMKDGVGNYTTEGRWSATSSSGTTVVFNGSDLQPDTFDIKGSISGQSVMSYSTNGWAYMNTPQEQKMQQTFLSKLNSAERSYKQYFNSGLFNSGQLEHSNTSSKSKDSVNYLI